MYWLDSSEDGEVIFFAMSRETGTGGLSLERMQLLPSRPLDIGLSRRRGERTM